MAEPPDATNFAPGRAWRWHGGVTTADQLAGHWADEPCPICDAPKEPGTDCYVVATDPKSGTITFGTEPPEPKE